MLLKLAQAIQPISSLCYQHTHTLEQLGPHKIHASWKGNSDKVTGVT